MTKDGLAGHGDEFYSALMALHEGLTEAESHALNARLILLMANEIGDMERLKGLMGQARSQD